MIDVPQRRPDGGWTTARELFPAVQNHIYLDHAAVAPISTLVRRAVIAGADAQVEHGIAAAPVARAEVARVRATLARLVGGGTDGVALLHNTSTALSIVANGIDWRPGDNVVLAEDEFPSNYYPWGILRSRGVDVRLVARDAHGSATAPIAECIDRNTRLVAISAVHYAKGFRHDLAALAEECRKHEALFVVDGTQAVGALAVDVESDGIDVLAVGAYKWMLGPLGTGFAHFSQRALDEVALSSVGWMSVSEPFAFDYAGNWDPTARRFEAGTANEVGIHGLRAAADLLLDLGPAAVEQRVVGLTSFAAQIITQTAHVRLRISSDPRARSGIVVVENTTEDAESTHKRLLGAGVLCSSRGGGVRLSPHFYNTEDEMATALDLIAEHH